MKTSSIYNLVLGPFNCCFLLNIYIFSFDYGMEYVLRVILTDLIHFYIMFFGPLYVSVTRKVHQDLGKFSSFVLFIRSVVAGTFSEEIPSRQPLCRWWKLWELLLSTDEASAHRRLNDTPLSHTTPQYLSEGFTEPMRRGSLGWNWGQKR